MMYRVRKAGQSLPESVKRPARGAWHWWGSQTAKFFSRYFYTRADLTWNNTEWLGVPLWKNPLDLWVYQEILFEVKPELIIETGTWHGGSAFYFASICDLLDTGKIITVDRQQRKTNPQHPRIEYIKGSSVDPDIVDLVAKRVADTTGPVRRVISSCHLRPRLMFLGES